MGDGSIWVYGTYRYGSGTTAGTASGTAPNIYHTYTTPTKLTALGNGWKTCITNSFTTTLLHTDGKLYAFGRYGGMYQGPAPYDDTSTPTQLDSGVSDVWNTYDYGSPSGILYRKGTEYYFMGDGGSSMIPDYPPLGLPTHVTSLSGLDIITASGGTEVIIAVTRTGELYAVGYSNGYITGMSEAAWGAAGYDGDGNFHRSAQEVVWSPATVAQEHFQMGFIGSDVTGQLYVATYQNDDAYVGHLGTGTSLITLAPPWPKINPALSPFTQFTSANYTWGYVSASGELFVQGGNYYAATKYGTFTDWVGVYQMYGQGPSSYLGIRRPTSSSFVCYHIAPDITSGAPRTAAESSVIELCTFNVPNVQSFSGTSQTYSGVAGDAGQNAIMLIDAPAAATPPIDPTGRVLTSSGTGNPVVWTDISEYTARIAAMDALLTERGF
jgi:hypothetical protein